MTLCTRLAQAHTRQNPVLKGRWAGNPTLTEELLAVDSYWERVSLLS